MSDTVLFYQVDAFSAKPFGGNPAAVCLLDSKRDDTWMQAVATEMNLSETAFVLARDDGFDLRWFTPTAEVRLCGHATLATAHVLWEADRLDAKQPARFHTQSGLLNACRAGGMIEIDLPAIVLQPAALPPGVAEALGASSDRIARTAEPERHDLDYLVELETEADVRAVRPDFAALSRAVDAGVIVTARSSSEGHDFISRYFAPTWGIDEDPVTGAAHCCLAPYWSEKLGCRELTGYQASVRGGLVRTRVAGDRVALAGEAVTVVRGELVC